jgi:hypothetical protein
VPAKAPTIDELRSTIDDAHAVLTEWDALNRQRVALIDLREQGPLSEAQAKELERLQRLADLKAEIVMPLPVEKVRDIRSLLATAHG